MCLLHGDDTPSQMDEHEIPLVIVKEFEKMGNLQNHHEVQRKVDVTTLKGL